uniref:Protein disulfide-isomerase n=1 Tax=Parastrongyloides trichosuri TaxID=131310 RepID=A0A0N5A4U9_PARTI
MKLFISVIFLSLFLLGFSDEIEKEDGVLIFTDSNFDKFLEENPTVLVYFYAPWCSHCKTMAPEFAKAAKELSIPLGKVDRTVEITLGDRYSINAFPSLKFWLKGKGPIDYDGKMHAEGVVEWVKKRIDPSFELPPDEVITLTEATFDDYVADKPLVLVEFYAPWCGHCKNLAPELEKAAKLLKPDGIPIAKIDATVEKKLADQFDVKGYPTMKVLRNGRRFDYEGPRVGGGIADYMRKQAKPAAKKLETILEAKRVLSKTDVGIIGFFANENGNQYDSFIDMSEKLREELKGSIGYTVDPEIIKSFKASPGDITIFYPEIFWAEGEPKQKTYNKKASTVEDIIAFLKENIAPAVGHMTRMNSAFRYTKLPLCVVYYNVDFSPQYREGTQYWRKKILKVAKKYKSSKYSFAVADETEFERELAEIGLGDSGLEHNVIVFGYDGKKYPMDPEKYDGDIEENLENFMKDINSGKVKAHFKSAPVPKEQKGPVKVVVGSTFTSVVYDETKDVLIEFYAPWCGHCKNFEPQYNELAEKFKKSQPNLIIAKMDATENDPPLNFKVEGFPTIYFAPSGKKEIPIKYTGNRALEDLESFMRKHAVKSFTGGKEEIIDNKKEKSTEKPKEVKTEKPKTTEKIKKTEKSKKDKKKEEL